MLYDPTPGLRSSIDISALKADIGHDLCFLFEYSADDESAAPVPPLALIPFPVGQISIGESRESIKAVLQAGGIGHLFSDLVGS